MLELSFFSNFVTRAEALAISCKLYCHGFLELFDNNLMESVRARNVPEQTWNDVPVRESKENIVPFHGIIKNILLQFHTYYAPCNVYFF